MASRILYPGSVILAAFACLIILGLNWWLPANASPEYIYTVQFLAKYAVPGLIFYILLMILQRYSRKIRIATHTAIWLCISGIVLIALAFRAPAYDYSSWYLPILLSLCWALGFFLFGLGCFFFASRKGAIVATIACFLGSIFMAAGIIEAYLLIVPANVDGLHYDNLHSVNVISGRAVPGESNLEYGVCGYRPIKKAVSTAHRYLNYDKVLYDVVYDFDENGRRATPAPVENPENDLMLFGCSFTFGHGLNTEETWPWKLATDLGPQWRVENYAYSGYSANQMLCMLEHDFITPPTAPRRYALFLSMVDHPRRNDSFPNSPHYVLDQTGTPKMEGKSPHVWVYTLSNHLNGSQLAKKLSQIGLGILERKYGEAYRKLNLAVIERSADILKEKYNTQLTVLLWPGMEYLAATLKERGIPAILAQNLLKDWKSGEANPGYEIAPPLEGHPNAKAASELAEGLALHYRKLAE